MNKYYYYMEYRKIYFDWFKKDHTLTIASLYSIFSNLDVLDDLIVDKTIDLDAKPLIDVLCRGLGREIKINYSKVNKHINNIKRSKNVVVAFSGGKDSTATAIKIRNCGLNVILFYVKGINKAYPDELEHAQEIAKKLGMQLHITNVIQSGMTSFKESPIKNQLIASMALDYAIENNIGCSISFGDFTTDTIGNSQFMESWSDTQEMWQSWLYLVRTYIPNAELIIPFGTYNETLDLLSENRDILDSVCGCILPYRFRNMTHANNEKKYNLKLLPNRCGSCWKCCTEYIFLVDKGVLPLNEKFYRHCLDFLVKKLPTTRPDVKEVNIKGAYEAFLHRDITKSVLYNDL